MLPLMRWQNCALKHPWGTSRWHQSSRCQSYWAWIPAVQWFRSREGLLRLYPLRWPDAPIFYLLCAVFSRTQKPTKWWGKIFSKNEQTFNASFALDESLKARISAREVTIHFSPGAERLRVEAVGAKSRDKNEQDLSVVWAKKITLEGEPQLACLIDGRPATRTPIEISVSSVRVPIIVGRARLFE